MLGNAQAVGFISVSDTDRARAFYGDMLGLRLTADDYALVAEVGGARLRITTLPEVKPQDTPAFGFTVPDVPAAVAALTAKGVTPEQYAFLGDAQDAQGIWTAPDGSKLAWFKDPDGNLLTVGSA